MASLENKVVLITGSGDETGIGAATALYMIQFQPKFVLTGRDETRLQRVGQLCKEAGLAEDRLLLVVGDLTKDSDLERLVETTINTFQQLDVLVNNAATILFKNLYDTSMAEYDAAMNINMRSPFYLTKLCLPHLVKTKGTIVNMSSVLGSVARTDTVAYSLSKAALEHFTRITAMEAAKDGVRVNSVSPGVTDTNLLTKNGVPEEMVRQVRDFVKSVYPLGRIGTPSDVAKAIVFLASDESSFTTGQILNLDGGYGLKTA